MLIYVNTLRYIIGVKGSYMKDQKIPEMITIAETAKRTGLSYETIRRLCLQGKISYIKVGPKGSKYMINFTRFIDYLNNKRYVWNTNRNAERR